MLLNFSSDPQAISSEGRNELVKRDRQLRLANGQREYQESMTLQLTATFNASMRMSRAKHYPPQLSRPLSIQRSATLPLPYNHERSLSYWLSQSA